MSSIKIKIKPDIKKAALINKAKGTIDRYSMLKKGDVVLAAVSGGPDSVCALEILNRLKDEYGLKLHVAHLNHKFRKEADKEAEFVRKLSEKKGIASTIEAIDVKGYCIKKGLSKQEGAREVRYDFLRKTADKIGAAKIVIGHTADDQAETFLMRLIRGSGALGLSGIPPVRGKIIRPLIEIRKSEALGFLKENDIRYVKDPTNIKPVYLRNKIRLELLPLLAKKYNSNIASTLCREADILREDESFLNGIADAILKEMVTVQEKDSITLNYLRFNGLHPAIKKRVIRRAIVELTGGLKRISYLHIISAIDAIKNTGKGVDLPDDIRIERDYNSLIVRTGEAESAGIQEAVQLEMPGITEVPYFNIKVEAIINNRAAVSKKADTALFDPDKTSLPLFIRGRREGDYFYPAGMKGRKKLKEFLIDHKIPRADRDKIPILINKNNDILWIMGLRMDERFKAREDTKRKLIVKVIRSVSQI
ncbi:MAG: tRNA lysidine(34) synthetase TilS [Nitrospirae bacterium]|nr:tRNA lysidine(34) synthetase TilS [Nitrospirota bacterium]